MEVAVSERKKLMIMAAGTGGHIFPGLAIAATMQKEGWDVTWLGTQHGMEGKIVPAAGIEMESIDFAGLRGKGLAHTIGGSIKLMTSFMTCRGIMKRRKPDLVVGMGGYVTVPGGMAARMLGIPVVLVNADAKLLLSNKALASSAKHVLFGLLGEYGEVAHKAVLTGNPIRQEIRELPQPEERFAGREGVLNIMVVGGSLGAKVLNDCLPAALALLPFETRPNVTHQTGRQHVAQVRQQYRKAQVNAEVLDFIDDMAVRYANADLVICRAGAITVSELTAAGVASILVPFIASSTSHQRDNAIFMDREGAATHLPQTSLTPEYLAGLLKEMTREKCLVMAKTAYSLGKRDANEKIAEVLIKAATR